MTTITEVENGVLWIGSHKGLTRYDTNTKRFYQYYKEEGGGNSLSDNCIKHILCDKRKRLWVGTISGLDLYNSETDDFERISDEGSIFWLMQRKNGNICYLVNNTLCILEPESMKTKKFHFDNDEKAVLPLRRFEQQIMGRHVELRPQVLRRRNGKTYTG